MDKDGMYEVSLDQALELLIRAAHQKDYDNVIYFATRIKEESKDWKRAPVQQTTSARAKCPEDIILEPGTSPAPDTQLK
jgi:hypothetical protein